MVAERMLWGAVLNQAVVDFVSPGYVYGLDPALIKRSAANWFLSTSRSLGSFLFICEVLNIDPAWFRKQLFDTSIDVLRTRVSTQYYGSRDKLVSVAASEEDSAQESWYGEMATVPKSITPNLCG